MAQAKPPVAEALKIKTADIIFGIIALVAIAGLVVFMKEQRSSKDRSLSGRSFFCGFSLCITYSYANLATDR